MWEDSIRVTVSTGACKAFLCITISSSFFWVASSVTSRTLFRITVSTSCCRPLLISDPSFVATSYFTTTTWLPVLDLHGHPICIYHMVFQYSFSSVGSTQLQVWAFSPQWNLTFSSLYSIDTRTGFIWGLVPLSEIYSIFYMISFLNLCFTSFICPNGCSEDNGSSTGYF